MNRLIMIGNGFDLAHGLKTSFKDFIEDYLSTAYSILIEKKSYEDELLLIYFNDNEDPEWLKKVVEERGLIQSMSYFESKDKIAIKFKS